MAGVPSSGKKRLGADAEPPSDQNTSDESRHQPARKDGDLFLPLDLSLLYHHVCPATDGNAACSHTDKHGGGAVDAVNVLFLLGSESHQLHDFK